MANHTSNIRNGILASTAIPISFISNVLRVITLVLITYYFGDEIGQSYVHNLAGIILFMLATGLTIGTDKLLGLAYAARTKKAGPK